MLISGRFFVYNEYMENGMLKYYKIIGQINAVISKSDTLNDALKNSLKALIDLCNANYVVIWYRDKQDVLHPYYWICPCDLSLTQYNSGEGVVGAVYKNDKSMRLLDYRNDQREDINNDFAGISISSFVCVPISNKYENVGVIELIKEEGQFSQDDADVFEIMANLISYQIEDSEKFKQSWQLGKSIISIKDVKKEYKNGEIITQVLKGVNLDIYDGEFVVLLGESGCGKSTLLNIIGGMDKVTSGNVAYLNQDLTDASQEELTQYRRDNIGFIFQSYNLMPNLTVKQNLDLIGELVDKPLDSMEALTLVGLADKKDNYPSQLSGGQQQRVSIARALIKNPKIIMADEPTAALDYDTSIEVLSALENVYKKGTTLVMVTHNEEITKMADRVIRMRNGRTYEITVNLHPLKASQLLW